MAWGARCTPSSGFGRRVDFDEGASRRTACCTFRTPEHSRRSRGRAPEDHGMALRGADLAAWNLGAAGLRKEQIAAVEKVRGACLACGIPSVLSPLEQEQREESIAGWLASHGAETAFAEALASTEITFEMLNELAGLMDGQLLNTAVEWIAAGSTTRRLASEIHEAASRIHDLVGAIKEFTQMDRAAVPEPVNVARGLASTLVVLRAKAKSKSVRLSLNIEN